MVHGKFQDHGTSRSGEEILKLCTIYELGCNLCINLCVLLPTKTDMKFCFDLPSGFREDVCHHLYNLCRAAFPVSIS